MYTQFEIVYENMSDEQKDKFVELVFAFMKNNHLNGGIQIDKKTEKEFIEEAGNATKD